MTKQKIVFVLFIFLCSTSSYGTNLIRGDQNALSGTSFSFSIKNNIMSTFGNFFVGSHELLTENQQYALSLLSRNSTIFVPIAPEKVVLNQVVDQQNPLFGAQITALNLLRPVNGADSPVVVTAANPASVCLVEKITTPAQISIVQTPPIHDANGQPSSGIINLETNTLTHVFGPVKPNSGQFGDDGSGIALLIRGGISTGIIFSEVDAQTGLISPNPKAFPLNKTSSLVTLNTSTLSSMGIITSLHWCDPLKRLFIGLDVTSGLNNNDGASAVIMGSLNETNGLLLSPILDTTAIAPGNTNNITAIRNQAGSTEHQVIINQLTTLYTSTGLNYLIVVGGVVTDNNTEKKVFALPLVNNGMSTGMIANKNDQPENIFSDGDIAKLVARNINTIPTVQDDITQKTDVAAQVGGGILPAGPITSIFSRDDTVFVCVGNEKSSNSASGIYSSQALFNAAGSIIGWSSWQRAVGTTSNVFDATLNVFDGTCIFMTGSRENTINTVNETSWSNGNPDEFLPVTNYINSLFNPHNGGVQSVQTFLPSTPGLSDISLMVVGGINRIVLIQTSTVEAGTTIPTPAKDFSIIIEFDDGTIDDFFETKIVSITGGDLNSIGPITASTIASDENTNGWLFVGGSDGLAIFSAPNGTGWNPALNQLGNNFDGLQSKMSFKKIGDYTFIKKLICDSKFLYVVAADRIDRINLATSNFGSGNLDVTTVLSKRNLAAESILDAVVSQAFALVATTESLVRVGTNKDIRTIESSSDGDWEYVAIPEPAGAPTQLIAKTKSGRSEDITRTIGGQIYVLTSNAGYDQSRINRFAISPLATSQPMQANTISPFDDLFVKNSSSFFLNFPTFNSIFSTDGALYFASHNKHSNLAPQVTITPAYPAPQVAARNVGERSSAVKINLNNGTEINALLQNFASGSWVVAGNFGMQVLE